MASNYIMVLNDGETFTDVEGCSIVEIDPGMEMEEIEALLKEIKFNEDLRDKHCVLNFQSQWR